MRQAFTHEQIETLQANEYVLRCTPKQIVFTEEFKISAVTRYSEGFMPSQIFREAGLDTSIIGTNTPKWCMKGWKKQLQSKGNFKDNRGKSGKGGRKPKEKIPKDEKEKMKYLEAKVAYLEKENDFLVKLRAKRAE
jgi:transposase